MNLTSEAQLSWLVLERYALGEVSASEHAVVEARLKASLADRERLDSILHDQVALKPLPALLPLRNAQAKPSHRRSLNHVAVLTLAAAAGLLALVDWRAASPDVESAPTPARTQTKGGDLSLSLVNRQGALNPESFEQGESFKVLVTCPPDLEDELRLFIFQGGARYEPLASTQLGCGNQMPWPGAFSLDGSEPATICVSANPTRANAWTVEALGAEATCTTLVPR